MTRHSASFDLLRLVAALMVVCSHQLQLNGYLEPRTPYYGTIGGLGVIIFFSLSGYLNCQSIFRSRSASTFLINRALRISPGVFVCSIFCIVLCAFVTTSSMTEYFTSAMGRSLPATVTFLFKNTFPIHRIGTDLPGVFTDNHFKTIVNGSLWTLPYEAKSYLLLALGAVIVRFNQSVAIRAYAVIFCCLALSGFFFSLDALLGKEILLRFLIVFSTGVFIALIENRFGSRGAIAVSVLIPLSFAASSNFFVAFLNRDYMPCPADRNDEVNPENHDAEDRHFLRGIHLFVPHSAGGLAVRDKLVREFCDCYRSDHHARYIVCDTGRASRAAFEAVVVSS